MAIGYVNVSPPQLALTTAAVTDTTIRLAVRGELDIATVGRFESALRELLSDPLVTHLVVDFAALDFCDSRGLAALHTALRTAQRRGIALTVTNCRGIVRRALDITGLYHELAREGTGGQRVVARVRAAPGWQGPAGRRPRRHTR